MRVRAGVRAGLAHELYAGGPVQVPLGQEPDRRGKYYPKNEDGDFRVPVPNEAGILLGMMSVGEELGNGYDGEEGPEPALFVRAAVGPA